MAQKAVAKESTLEMLWHVRRIFVTAIVLTVLLLFSPWYGGNYSYKMTQPGSDVAWMYAGGAAFVFVALGVLVLAEVSDTAHRLLYPDRK